MGRSQKIKLVIDGAVLERYNEYYFSIHTRAKKPPIKQPYHESINQWMILRRPMMNALKAKWKDFIKWFIDDLGLYGFCRISCRQFCNQIDRVLSNRYE